MRWQGCKGVSANRQRQRHLDRFGDGHVSFDQQNARRSTTDVVMRCQETRAAKSLQRFWRRPATVSTTQSFWYDTDRSFGYHAPGSAGPYNDPSIGMEVARCNARSPHAHTHAQDIGAHPNKWPFACPCHPAVHPYDLD